LQTTGPETVNSEGQIEVPIRVVVMNRGGVAAGTFKVSTEYIRLEGGGLFTVRFTVLGPDSTWYPFTKAPLAAGSEVTFAGTVTFPSALQGQTVSLRAVADSCSGDELMPDYCRVEESNEDNNLSREISVRLPSEPVTLYDFVQMAPKAVWTGYAPPTPGDDVGVWYSLEFSDQDQDSRGFARWEVNAALEDGSRAEQVLETHPTWVDKGAIQGRYSLMAPISVTFQEGDRFAARVGFLEGAGAGNVTFVIEFWDGDPDSSPRSIASMTDPYDGTLRDWTVPLPDDLIGQSGYFYLRVDAGSTSTQDWAVWVEARLERP
jgi:hypothetical protein